MCGIFGMIYYGRPSLLVSELKDVKETMSNLLSASQSRGRDASGICVVTTEKKALMLRHHIQGGNLPVISGYGKIMDQLCYNNNFRYMIGHTRAKTQGTEQNNVNNHPIIAGDVVGVHNGAISNDYALFKMYESDFKRAGKVDSEIIFRLIDHHMKSGCSLVEATQKTSRALIGWYSCAFIHTKHPNYLTLFGDSSPNIVINNYFGYSFMIFASTNKILSDATDCISRFRYPSSKLELGGSSGIRINTTNGKILKFQVEPKKEYNNRHFYGII